jgi:protein PhnA
MADALACPICTMSDPLLSEDGFECGTCGHEWLAELSDGVDDVHDANGNLLANGDDVTVIKDVKLDGKAGGVKAGTKMKGIRLVPGDHPIDGKINGRAIVIKAEFVKKA